MLRVAEHFEKSDTGRQRRANEDSLFARAPVFVVADGMGGHAAGDKASAAVVERLAALLVALLVTAGAMVQTSRASLDREYQAVGVARAGPELDDPVESDR